MKSHIDDSIKKLSLDLLRVEKIITYCKCNNVIYGFILHFYIHKSVVV